MTCVVDDICDDLFAGCGGITSLVLPEGITSIGESAFAGEFTDGMGLGPRVRWREEGGWRVNGSGQPRQAGCECDWIRAMARGRV